MHAINGAGQYAEVPVRFGEMEIPVCAGPLNVQVAQP